LSLKNKSNTAPIASTPEASSQKIDFVPEQERYGGLLVNNDVRLLPQLKIDVKCNDE
jgi:hypothetical protein